MARAASGSIKWNRDALYAAVDEVGYPLVQKATQIATERANAMSSGFRTGLWHDHATGETKGDTQPQYASEVNFAVHYHHGVVYTANYAAMKDTKENNTLLKAVPHV